MCYHFIALYFFFFFKQKTAYEMRISDWSSDVCSSDLAVGRELGDDLARRRAAEQHRHLVAKRRHAGHHRRLDEARTGGRNGLRHLLLDRRGGGVDVDIAVTGGSDEHPSELQSLMRTSDAVFCLKTKKANIRLDWRLRE